MASALPRPSAYPFGYSAHADQQGLVNFVKRMRIRPKQVRLVQEEEARQALAAELRKLGMVVD